MIELTAEGARKWRAMYPPLAEVLRAFNILFSMPGYLWSGVLLLAALMLTTYREPKGAYERQHKAH